MGNRRCSRGMAYLAVLVFVLIITVCGLAFLQLVNLEDRLFTEEANSSRALQACEAGVQRTAWALRLLPVIQTLHADKTLNPFHRRWYIHPTNALKAEDLLQMVNPGEGQPFYPNPGDPYYRICDLSGSGTSVRLRILGSVDSDGDGEGGIGDQDGDGYAELVDADPQDSNRFMEIYLTLPGTLAKNVSLAAQRVLDSENRPIRLIEEDSERPLLSRKLKRLENFWYDRKLDSGSDRAYAHVISKLVLIASSGEYDVTGEVHLPKTLFLADGSINRDYFKALPHRREFTGDPVVFDPSPESAGEISDPTTGTAPGTIIWVNGNLIIRDVDLGVVSPGGEQEGSDWERTDVIVVATGDITLERTRFKWPGRIVLVSEGDIHFWGGKGDSINGIAVAAGDIYLRSSSSRASDHWVYVPDPPRQTDAAFFFGTMIAKGDVVLGEGGWAVIFDPMVINGTMGRDPPPREMDDFEGEGVGPCWSALGHVTTINQGQYLQDELDNRAGDWADGGVDGVPQVLRIAVRPGLTNLGLGETVRFALDGSGAGGCAPGVQDWSPYSAMEFDMAMDNYSRETDIGGGVTLSTLREARFTVMLRDGDASPHQIEYSLNHDDDPLWSSRKYLSEQWGTAPYVIAGGDIQDPDPAEDDYADGLLPRWKRMEVPFSGLHVSGGAGWGDFNFTNVREVVLRLDSVKLRWTESDRDGNLLSYAEVRGEPAIGRLVFEKDGSCPSTIRLEGGRFQYLDPACYNPVCRRLGACDDWHDLLWDANGVDENGDGDYEDDFMGESDLVTNLRLDRLGLPGITMMDYGLTPCFSLEATRWRELTEEDIRP